MHCGDGVGRRRRALRAHFQPSHDRGLFCTQPPPAYFGAVSPLEATPALVRRGELRVEGDEVANRRDAGVALDHLALQ